MRQVTVHVLTFCSHPVFAYGSLLVFDTLRIGFPTARVEVVDNGSHADMVPRIRAAAESVGASFEARSRIHYADHWRDNLFSREWPDSGAPVVFVDPDCVFWSNCESWDFGDALLAGRLIPEIPAGPGRVDMRRLHPSHLWVPSITRFRAEFAMLPTEAGGRWDCIGPATESEGRVMRRFNTLAPLFHALRAGCAAFDESQLDAFDHLHMGSHLTTTHGHWDALADAHRAAAEGDIGSLRGLWRRQNESFLSPAPPVPAPHGVRRPRITARDLRDWQRLAFTDAELDAAEYALSAQFSLMVPSRRGAPRPRGPSRHERGLAGAGPARKLVLR